MRVHAASDGYSLRELFVDASAPGFLDTARSGSRSGGARMRSLCDRVERLAPDAARCLLSSLRKAACAAWGGREALAMHLAALEASPSLHLPLHMLELSSVPALQGGLKEQSVHCVTHDICIALISMCMHALTFVNH